MLTHWVCKQNIPGLWCPTQQVQAQPYLASLRFLTCKWGLYFPPPHQIATGTEDVCAKFSIQ